MSDLRFRVRAVAENPTRTVVKARKFHMVIDEPPDLGGGDTGANPVEYAIAALSGCLNVMGHVVAGEMGLHLKGLKIDIMGELNPDRLFGKPTGDRAGYKNIKVIMRPQCDADEAQLVEWLEKVESRCPVSDNLANPTPMEIFLN